MSIEAGIHHDLNEAIYHADPTSLSVSGAKTILKAPAKFQWEREHPVHKDQFDFGSAAHGLILGTGWPLQIIEADDWRTKDAKDAKAAAHEAGEIPLLAKDYATVQAMADALSEHGLAMELLSAGKAEVSAFAVDEATGVMRRGRADWLRDDMVVDYKTAVSAHPDAFAKACASYGYFMQHAWYVDLFRDLGVDLRGFAFIAQDKTAPYIVEVYELDFDAVTFGRERNAVALQRYRDCSESGIWPGYTGDQSIKPLSLPGWTYRQEISA